MRPRPWRPDGCLRPWPTRQPRCLRPDDSGSRIASKSPTWKPRPVSGTWSWGSSSRGHARRPRRRHRSPPRRLRRSCRPRVARRCSVGGVDGVPPTWLAGRPGHRTRRRPTSRGSRPRHRTRRTTWSGCSWWMRTSSRLRSGMRLRARSGPLGRMTRRWRTMRSRRFRPSRPSPGPRSPPTPSSRPRRIRRLLRCWSDPCRPGGDADVSGPRTRRRRPRRWSAFVDGPASAGGAAMDVVNGSSLTCGPSLLGPRSARWGGRWSANASRPEGRVMAE